jgi:hypothetical protein
MKALLTSVVAGLGVLAFMSSGSAQSNEPVQSALRKVGGCVMPEPQVKEYIGITLQGKIHKVDSFLLGRSMWQVTVEGRTYELDLGPNKKKHWLMNGQTVLVTGRLQHRIDSSPVALCGQGWDGKRPRPPIFIHSWAVVVDTLKYVDDARRGEIAVEIRGTLRMKGKVGYPAETLSVVTADGQTVVLDFGKSAVLKLRGELLDGAQVVLRGSLGGWHAVREMCMPNRFAAPELPVVRVSEIAEVEEVDCKVYSQFCGKLTYSKKPADPKWDDDSLPRWQLTVGNTTHTLEFGNHAELAKLAKQLEGKSVEIVGELVTREYFIGMRPRPDGTTLDIARVVKMQVLVVKTMQSVQR